MEVSIREAYIDNIGFYITWGVTGHSEQNSGTILILAYIEAYNDNFWFYSTGWVIDNMSLTLRENIELLISINNFTNSQFYKRSVLENLQFYKFTI